MNELLNLLNEIKENRMIHNRICKQMRKAEYSYDNPEYVYHRGQRNAFVVSERKIETLILKLSA